MKKKQPEPALPKAPNGLDALFSALESRFGSRARRNEPLSAHTTLRLGGPADLWFPARSVSELVEAASLARQHRVPIFLLGGGANLLIREAGVRGLVIENQANAVRFEGEKVIAESGAILPRLAKRCAQQGLSGLEWAVGVPGTIGGATVNNAGAYGASMADILARAEILTLDGERVWQPVDWFEYEYRSSRLKAPPPPPSFGFAQDRRGEKSNKIPPSGGLGGPGRKHIVLQVELALTPASTTEIEATMHEYTARRKATQPPGATIGSMFKNPPGDYAGRLIEAAGLKGYRVNQAQISPLHANFFVNLSATTSATLTRSARLKTDLSATLKTGLSATLKTGLSATLKADLGGASADDVIELVKIAQKQVLDKFGVMLELEIEIV